ncbi:hypothetical protein BVRB_6g156040 [Beta vulgaris subsp. vulgaris]|uniref:NPH3 domain-containing protein n=1 Tax=Beta vulgaris subsp. vulgaris TaxID=3555 RepID=A0A0J8BBH3_BETVV|nr:hypothetical protein BVRB_6g156040 [Beta vulgaris subsp. vulgaris]
MVLPRTQESSFWCSKHTNSSNNLQLLCNASIKFDKVLLAKRSATIASLLEQNPDEDVSAFLKEIPSEHETLELIARFCHNFDVKMTSDNIISLICVSNHLKMTEFHSPNNLLNNAIAFLQQNILPSWDQIIRSLRALRGPTFEQAVKNGLFNICVEALTEHVASDPTRLAQPIMVEYANNSNRPMIDNSNVTRRKLFAEADHSETSLCFESPSEDLTSLPLRMYESIIEAMAEQKVRQENIAGSLYRCLKRNEANREAIETVERLLPDNTYTSKNTKYTLYPYAILLDMYASAVSVEASSECIASLENRIGKDLYRITIEDLLALDLDVESIRRILKGYYGNFTDHDSSGLVAVAELMEEYLLNVAKTREIDVMSFIEITEMTSSASNLGNYRCSDGIYNAVVAYLEKHKELSESAKEEICRVLDFQLMSPEACKHAATNRVLPLRVVVQVLFESQLQLRDNISKAVCEYRSNSNVGDEGRRADEEIKVVEDEEWENDEREEIKECHEKNCCEKKGKKKVSLWKGMKRKFGCMGSSDYETLHGCNCQTTKKNKKKKGV